MTRQTSVEAYNAIKESGVLGEREWQTYHILFNYGPMTQAECWDKMPRFAHVPQRSITPRFARLLRKGFIKFLEEDGKPLKRHCKVSGRKCMVWDVTNASEAKPEQKHLTQLQQATLRIKELEAKIAWLEKSPKRPSHPYHIALETAGHRLIRDLDGDVDIFRMDNGTHNGPECELCHQKWCHHCMPDISSCSGKQTSLP